MAFFLLPGLQMLIFHTHLITKNLTTNELQNIHRYKYLQDDAGRIFSPWNQGFMHNFYQRMCPGPECYELPKPSVSQQSREMMIMRGDGSNGGGVDGGDDRQRLLSTSV